MDKELNSLIKKTIDIANGSLINLGRFYRIYPFTTENIAGYIDMFDLKNKSLLTVGSSGDQVINAMLKDCKDITVIDINPFAKYYFYLKKAALLTLDYEEFCKFFCYVDYPMVFKYNLETFNFKSYESLRKLLKKIDKESFMFWENLFNNCKSIDIRKNLFEYDEDRLIMLKHMNLYLKDESMFSKSKMKIRNINPKFITGDIFKTKLERSYDNVFLSNIGAYYSIKELKLLIDKLDNVLNHNGNMLICYLYKTKIDTKYKDEWIEIYNLDKTFEILKNYITFFESFIGVQGIKFEDENMKDSVIIYQKKEGKR